MVFDKFLYLGMVNTSLDKVIYLDEIINMTRVTVYDSGPFKMLYPIIVTGNFVEIK